jgi:Xaa-Pro dipeptidase
VIPQSGAAVRLVFEKAGVLSAFRHRITCTIGIGFPPTWGSRVGGDVNYLNATPRSGGVLQPGMVFHLIPLLIVPGVGAVGFSETVLVTGSGAEVLTDVPRRLASR